MRRFPSDKTAGILVTLLLVLGFCMLPAPARAREPVPLQLEVHINNRDSGYISAFTLHPDGRMSSLRSELTELGLKPPGTGPPDEVVFLDAIPALTYRYDEPGQRMLFTAGDGARQASEYDARGMAPPPPARSDTGLAVNYLAFAGSELPVRGREFTFSGASLSLDARAFSDWGLLTQTAILGATTFDDTTALRLDTAWSYYDAGNLLTYRAGDIITGGLQWTRPVRLGGTQVSRNFGLRPDLVTAPLPTLTGSAAVPSTVDVFVDNVKVYTRQVNEGPFSISNVPVLSGGGTARVVVRDVTGRETSTELPFFTAPLLLKPGLWDFSAEAGFARLHYGYDSFAYDGALAASLSFRHGFQDWLTIEGHAEATGGLGLAGVGAVFQAGPKGLASAAVSASTSDYGTGAQAYAGYDLRFGDIYLQLSTQRTFGEYADLASITADAAVPGSGRGLPGIVGGRYIGGFARPLRSIDRVSLNFPLIFDPQIRIGIGYIPIVEYGGRRSELATLTFGRSLPYGASLFGSAFTDLADGNKLGLYAGVAFPLGYGMSGSVGAQRSQDSTLVTADAIRPMGREPGSTGWRVTVSEGDEQRQEAGVGMRTGVARLGATVRNFSDQVTGTAEVEGAIVWMGGRPFLSERIDDAFAVVEVGVPGVEVLYEHRRVGVTDDTGRLLVPDLRSYQKNRLAIDPQALPLDAEATRTETFVTPAMRSGLRVGFDVETDTRPAVVVLHGADGKPLPAGSAGRRSDGEAFVIGYDGEAFLKKLAPTNTVEIETPAGKCMARFGYKAEPGSQTRIGPVLCRSEGDSSEQPIPKLRR